MLNLLQTIEVYESRYKHQAKLFTEKLFVSSLNSIVQFHFISFDFDLGKYVSIISLIRLQTCNFITAEPFCRFSCFIPIIQGYPQNAGFSCFLSKFLKQFQNSKNSKFSRVPPNSYFRNQFVIIANEIMYKKLTFYLRNFNALISFLFYLYKTFIFV